MEPITVFLVLWHEWSCGPRLLGDEIIDPFCTFRQHRVIADTEEEADFWVDNTQRSRVLYAKDTDPKSLPRDILVFETVRGKVVSGETPEGE